MRVYSEKRLAYIRELAVKKNRQIFENKPQQINSQATYASTLVRDPQVAKIALAMLYLGEGAKWKGRRGLLLGSSDPRIINIYLHLLEEGYGIKKKMFAAEYSIVQIRMVRNY